MGDDVWLSITFARVAIEEAVPVLDGDIIVAAQTVRETSADGPLVGLLTMAMPSDSTVDPSVLGKVSMTVKVGDNVRGETASEGPHESLGIPTTPDFGVLERVSSTTMVQVCDGNEDRTGDGGGDHATSGISWG